MKPLFNQSEFDNAKTNHKLPCECYSCKNTFYKTKSAIKYELKNKRGEIKFCSLKCRYNNQITQVQVNCKNCNKEFFKIKAEAKRSPNHFCSQSCSAIYRNTHKTYGTRRSKLEIYIEGRLTTLYSNLDIHFNRKDAISSELDIYIPSLKLAFELNGIFHYEPIFGSEKFSQIQNNDQNKFQACLESNISLCIIDTSSLKFFKENKANKFLDIITSIINNSLYQ